MNPATIVFLCFVLCLVVILIMVATARRYQPKWKRVYFHLISETHLASDDEVYRSREDMVASLILTYSLTQEQAEQCVDHFTHGEEWFEAQDWLQ